MNLTKFIITHLLSALFLVGLSQNQKDKLLYQSQNGTLEERYDALVALTDLYDYDDVDSSVLLSRQLVSVANEIGDNDRLGEAYRIEGIYFMDAGLYDQAIESYYRAIDFFDAANTETEKEDIAGCYHDLAWIYTYQEDYSRTAEFFHKSMVEVQDYDDSVNNAVSFHALGSFYYLYDKNEDSAIYYMEKAVTWRKKLNSPIEVFARNLVELCNAYYMFGRISEGDSIILEARNIPAESVSEYVSAYIYYLQGLRSKKTGDLNEALNIYRDIYDILIDAGNHKSEIAINLLREIVELTDKMEEYEIGYQYLSILRNTERESIYRDRQRITKVLEVEYETKRKQQQLENQELIISNQNRIVATSVIFIFILLIFSIVLYRVYSKVKDQKSRIETLMRELHHRVKNNLQVISSLLGLQSMKLTDESAQKAVEEGKERIRAMSLIHQKLYTDENVTSLNVKEYINSLVIELAQSYGFSEENLQVEIPEKNFDVETTLPLGLIINELVSNAFKYAFKDIKKPLLELKLVSEDKGQHTLIIRDNGVGIPDDFNFENTSSFGLKLVNILSKQLKGKLLIDTNNGLKYSLTFST